MTRVLPPRPQPYPADLPMWMRRALRGNDWGLPLSAVFALLMSWPLWSGVGLPALGGLEAFAVRVGGVRTALLEGTLWPRWASDALGGVGAPIPHFAPPGASWLAGLLSVLLTDDLACAVALVLGLAALCGACGTYALVLRVRGAAAGVLAALLYASSPFVSVTAPRTLGDVPLALALGLLPLVLWASDRLLMADARPDFALLAGLVAALLLVHPPTALAALLLAGGLLAVRPVRQTRVSAWGAAWLTGAVLAAFWWLPALVEAGLVVWLPAPSTAPTATLLGLFAPAPPPDARALLPQAALTAGLACTLLLLGGLAVTGWRRRFGWRWEAMLVVAGTLFVWAATRGLGVWWLGPLTLCAALIGGRTADLCTLDTGRGRVGLCMVVFAIVGLSSGAWWPQHGWGPLTDARTSTAATDDARVGAGGQHLTAPLPVVHPAQATLPRADAPSLVLGGASAAAQASVLHQRSHSATLQVTTRATPTALKLRLAGFPGWRATLDGAPLFTAPDPADGLLTVALPVFANGTVRVWLGPTPPRQWGWLLSALAALLVVRVTWQRQRPEIFEEQALLPAPGTRLLALQSGLLAGLLALVALSQATLTLPWPGAGVLSGLTPAQLRTSAGLELVGYQAQISGEHVQLRLVWRAFEPVAQPWQVHVTLADLHVSGQPLTPDPRRWPRGALVEHWLLLRDAGHTPTGEFVLALRDCPSAPCAEGDGAHWFATDGTLLGQYARLRVESVPPDR